MADLNVDAVRLTVLGGLAACTAAGEVTLPRSRKARALLAYLAAADDPCRKSSICEILFSRTSDPAANLRWCLSRLRSSFGDKKKELVCSDAKFVWLGCGASCVDIRRLREIRRDGIFGSDEYDFLCDYGREQFLPNLEVSSAPEYETWRATMQVHLERLLESILEQAVAHNDGSRLSLKYAELLTQCAPYSETAWSLLISALQKVNRTHHARRFLRIATSQLREAGVVQTGLLARASHELSAAENRRADTGPETFAAGAAASPLVVISIDPFDLGSSPDETIDEFGEALVSAATANKSTVLVAGKQASNSDLSLAPRIRKRNRRYVVDMKLTDERTGVCLAVWETEIAFASLNRMVDDLRTWLGAKFEIDLAIQLSSIALNKPTHIRSASDYLHMALPKIYSPAGYVVHDAMSLLREALRIDPNYGPALCGMAWVRSTHSLYNQAHSERQKTAGMARRSLELSYDNAFVLGWAAITIGHMESNPQAGLTFASRALDINAYSPFARLAQGVLRHYAGDFPGSIESLQSLQQSSVEPIAFICDTYLALNFYQSGEYEEAIGYCSSAISKNPGYVVTYRALIPSLVRVGKLDDARAYARKLIELDTSETLQYFRRYLPYGDKAAKRKIIKDLEVAGVPETIESLAK